MLRDEEGFQMKYVPKDQIMDEDSAKKGGKRERKGTDGSSASYIYVKKNQTETPSSSAQKSSANKSEAQSSTKKNNMQSLLSGLKPNSEEKGSRFVHSDSEDEDVKRILSRKVSMNEQNVIGMNFEKYND